MKPNPVVLSAVVALRSRKSDAREDMAAKEARGTAKEASAIAKEGASTGPVLEAAVVMAMITDTTMLQYLIVRIIIVLNLNPESTKRQLPRNQ
jgi:hypothetical protein